MVRILICPECQREVRRTKHLDLYSTYRSVLFGCEHSIKNLEGHVQEQASARHGKKEVSNPSRASGFTLLKHSKIFFKKGRLSQKGDRLPLKTKIPPDLYKA